MSTDKFGHNAHGMAGRSYEQQWSPDQSCPEKSEIKNEIKYYLRPWQTRTRCCRHKCFPLPARATFVADTNVVSGTKNVSDFVQKHFVSQFAQPKKHHGQQCVRNNVSSFTRTFRFFDFWTSFFCLSFFSFSFFFVPVID